MKRPEGFDAQPAESERTRPESKKEPKKKVAPKKPEPKKRESNPPPHPPAAQRPTTAKASPQRSEVPHPSRQPRPGPGERGELRRAAREKRRSERAEVRRFTRRARNRRIALLSVGGIVLALAGLVVTAVYSPLLALREVSVEGTSRINPEEVATALEGQLGTPLALLDNATIERELGAFPLIRSYNIQTVPPGTLVVQIVERQPVASVATASGFSLVDPAGIVLQESTERIAGVPFIDLAGAPTDSAPFKAAVEVLLSLPPELLAQVESVTAHTQDDVSLVLAGVGQRVNWGAADDSAKKAALLASLISVTDPAQPGEFDVSAPTNGVFRPA